MESEAANPEKKKYHPPQLSVYGDIRELTQAIGGTTGKNDGGAGKDKTGL